LFLLFIDKKGKPPRLRVIYAHYYRYDVAQISKEVAQDLLEAIRNEKMKSKKL